MNGRYSVAWDVSTQAPGWLSILNVRPPARKSSRNLCIIQRFHPARLGPTGIPSNLLANAKAEDTAAISFPWDLETLISALIQYRRHVLARGGFFYYTPSHSGAVDAPAKHRERVGPRLQNE
jgi:hypothetical protein